MGHPNGQDRLARGLDVPSTGPGIEAALGGHELGVPGDVSWGLKIPFGVQSAVDTPKLPLPNALGGYPCSQHPPLPFSLTLKEV